MSIQGATVPVFVEMFKNRLKIKLVPGTLANPQIYQQVLPATAVATIKRWWQTYTLTSRPSTSAVVSARIHVVRFSVSMTQRAFRTLREWDTHANALLDTRALSAKHQVSLR